MRKINFKKCLCLLLTLGLLLSMTACGSSENNTENTSSAAPAAESEMNTAPEASETAADSETENARMLVVYFSRTGEQYTVGVIDHGNTAIVAEMIADETGADLFEILPVDDHYPMTYDELTDVAKQEQNENARPAYAGEVLDHGTGLVNSFFK